MEPTVQCFEALARQSCPFCWKQVLIHAYVAWLPQSASTTSSSDRLFDRLPNRLVVYDSVVDVNCV